MIRDTSSRRALSRAASIAAIATMAGLAATLSANASRADGPQAARAAPAKPSDIRLLHGPQIFRLKTYNDPDRYEPENYRYALVAFMADVRFGVLSDDDLGDAGAGYSAGNYSIGGAFLTESAQTSYAPKRRRYRCVVAYLDSGSGDVSSKDLRALNRVKVGEKVPVQVQPLLAGAPHLKYGRTYHRRATMRQGGTYKLSDARTQKQLRDIDCNRR